MNVASNHNNYRPELFYKFKTTWISTYSEKTVAEGSTLEQEFWIRIYDRCITDTLTIQTDLSD